MSGEVGSGCFDRSGAEDKLVKYGTTSTSKIVGFRSTVKVCTVKSSTIMDEWTLEVPDGRATSYLLSEK